MKPHIRLLSILTTLIISMAALSCRAEPVPGRTVSTSGNGIVRVVADSVRVEMQATSTQKAAKTAKDEVDQRINRLIDALAPMKLPADAIIASRLQLNPKYEYFNRDKVFSGFTASRDISVTLSSTEGLDALLQTVISSGIDNINQVVLEHSEADKYRELAMDSAIADSKAKAEKLARAYGAELGAIYSISYSGSAPLAKSQPEMLAMRSADASGGGQYLHDEIEFQDSIQVVYELIIPH